MNDYLELLACLEYWSGSQTIDSEFSSHWGTCSSAN